MEVAVSQDRTIALPPGQQEQNSISKKEISNIKTLSSLFTAAAFILLQKSVFILQLLELYKSEKD